MIMSEAFLVDVSIHSHMYDTMLKLHLYLRDVMFNLHSHIRDAILTSTFRHMRDAMLKRH